MTRVAAPAAEAAATKEKESEAFPAIGESLSDYEAAEEEEVLWKPDTVYLTSENDCFNT